MSKFRRTISANYNIYLDVISFQTASKNRFETIKDAKDFTEEQKKKLISLSERDDIYELLSRSVAPSIWENEDVKKGILCQLFGGTEKNFAEAQRGRFRSEINCLLVGDPSTAKS